MVSILQGWPASQHNKTWQRGYAGASAARFAHLVFSEVAAGDAVVVVDPQVAPRHLLILMPVGARLPVMLTRGGAWHHLKGDIVCQQDLMPGEACINTNGSIQAQSTAQVCLDTVSGILFGMAGIG